MSRHLPNIAKALAPIAVTLAGLALPHPARSQPTPPDTVVIGTRVAAPFMAEEGDYEGLRRGALEPWAELRRRHLGDD